jgi:soluble lytic murein transglycosylase
MVADLAHETHRDDLVVSVAKSLRLKGTELIEYLYPLRRIPDGHGPEQGLVLAVMRQESAFAVDAISPAGARGLMQLMPNTAKHVAGQLRLRYDKERLIDDPNYNVVLGRAYLDDLVRSFRGSYVLALASYNAGPSRAVEWMRLNGDPRDYGIDVVDWIESIPFSETRNYVQRVLESRAVYELVLDAPDAVAIVAVAGGRVRDARAQGPDELDDDS